MSPAPRWKPPQQKAADKSPLGAALDDEYGAMDKNDRIFRLDKFTLESDIELPQVSVAYRTWGELNAAGDNVLFIAHALTGNAACDAWWAMLHGEGRAFDPSKYYIVCANTLGSCYGTTGPLHEMPVDPAPAWVAPREGTSRAAAGRRYAADFPFCTVRDTVALHYELLKHLGVTKLHAVVGGSAGGMQALEWALMYPQFVSRVVSMACGAMQSAWQIGISESQRQALYRDAKWNDGFYAPDAPPAEGLSIARQQAMIWYRSQPAYDKKFGRHLQPPSPGGAAARAKESSGGGGTGAPPTHSVEGYLEHQGTKFVERFDANCYVALTRLIDSHDVGRGRGGVEAALATLRCPVLVIGLSSDVLYPIGMQRELARLLPRGTLRVVVSEQGHDGFLLEGETIGALVTDALDADTDETTHEVIDISLDVQPPTGSPVAAPLASGRDTSRLPTSQKEMNAMLAADATKTSPRRRAPMLSPAQEWFFGI